MSLNQKRVLVLSIITLLIAAPFFAVKYIPKRPDPIAALFQENCAICHGDSLEGTTQGPSLLEDMLTGGQSVDAIRRSIAVGMPKRGMPAWENVLKPNQLDSLAIYIAEKRFNFDMQELGVADTIVIPNTIAESEQHHFKIETFAKNIDPLPFSIAPLPDGRWLLTEKERGVSIISADGLSQQLIQGTPEAHNDSLQFGQIAAGLGWFLEIAPHPQYAENGWVYLHYGDRCKDDCEQGGSFLSLSMNRVDRAQITDGHWTDVETVWRAPANTYTAMPEVGAGGRLAFDDSGHLFISTGMKDGNDGIQDVSKPYGKVHRVLDDGRIPDDNPITGNSVWTFGHRNPQGLEFNYVTQELWGSEHGPRGGDEINLLLPGRNYGWPLYSKGVDYDGSAIARKNSEVQIEDTEQPVVDLSPSPGASSFVFYNGDAFPDWQGNILLGSLKAQALYRIVLKDNQVIHQETLISGLARIRDVEIGTDGLVYLLLESKAGSQIARLAPQ